MKEQFTVQIKHKMKSYYVWTTALLALVMWILPFSAAELFQNTKSIHVSSEIVLIAYGLSWYNLQANKSDYNPFNIMSKIFLLFVLTVTIPYLIAVITENSFAQFFYSVMVLRFYLFSLLGMLKIIVYSMKETKRLNNQFKDDLNKITEEEHKEDTNTVSLKKKY